MITRRSILACGISGALLVAVGVEWRLFHPEFAGADEYHRRVRRAIEEMPPVVGNWVSEEKSVLPAAQAMLRPNVILSRLYTNPLNGQRASFLLVQCLDARDLFGHYPPNCYKSNGYTQQGAEPRHYTFGSLEIEGTLYTFSFARPAGPEVIKVFDFMILPDGRTAPDMDGVSSIARDRRIRHFGAAQVQVVTDDSLSDQDRESVIAALLGGAQGAIDVISKGVAP